jgi:hypothetical protein
VVVVVVMKLLHAVDEIEIFPAHTRDEGGRDSESTRDFSARDCYYYILK